MDDATRQQRRQLQREQMKAGRAAMATGLATGPRRADVIAVARVLKSKLAEHDNPRRASEAAALAQALNETSLKARPPTRVKIACSKGCSYCCYGFVGILPPEAFRLADAVRAGRAGKLDAATVRARTVPLRGLGPDARIGRKLACPLLGDGGVCSVYADRPLVCRQATSLSLPACIEEFEGIDREGRIEVSQVHLAHSGNAHVILLGALAAVGLPTEAFELSGALDVALAEPDAERRWLAGEAIFANLPRNVARSADVTMVANTIAQELRG